MSLEQQVSVVTEFRDAEGNITAIYDEKNVLMGFVDKVLGDSLEEEGLDKAGEALRRLRNLSQASSVSAAKLLHGVNSHWKEWEHEEDDTFLIWAVRETGYDKYTVKKRVCEWEFLEGNYIPKPHRPKIVDNYTIRQLDKIYSIRVASKENKGGGYLEFIEEDYEVTDKQWLQLAEAIDEQAVGEVVKEIKNKESNSNALSLKIDEDGLVWAYQGKDSQTVGQLFVEKKHPLVEKAIRRITENAAITERNEY